MFIYDLSFFYLRFVLPIFVEYKYIICTNEINKIVW